MHILFYYFILVIFKQILLYKIYYIVSYNFDKSIYPYYLKEVLKIYELIKLIEIIENQKRDLTKTTALAFTDR